MKKSIEFRKKVCITLAACLFACFPATAMATDAQISPDAGMVESEEHLEGSGISIKAIATSRITFFRQSNSVGTGSVYFMSLKTPSSLSATITLQQAAKGSNSYRKTSQAAVTKTVRNSRALSKEFRFTISTTKKYRVKVVVKENVGGTVSTKIYYKNLD